MATWVQAGETPAQSAHKNVKRETTLSIDPARFRGVCYASYLWQFRKQEPAGQCWRKCSRLGELGIAVCWYLACTSWHSSCSSRFNAWCLVGGSPTSCLTEMMRLLIKIIYWAGLLVCPRAAKALAHGCSCCVVFGILHVAPAAAIPCGCCHGIWHHRPFSEASNTTHMRTMHAGNGTADIVVVQSADVSPEERACIKYDTEEYDGMKWTTAEELVKGEGYHPALRRYDGWTDLKRFH